jgi:hypothetical protein
MEKFYSIEQLWEYYFPKETAERREQELMESDPGEWGRRKAQESLDRVFKDVKL